MPSAPFALPLDALLPDWASLRAEFMPAGHKVVLRGRRDCVEQHLEELASEFAGESRIEYHHAYLVVLIRRGMQADRAYSHFKSMWRSEGAHLLSNLSARWLVAACDTITDCDEDSAERAIAACGAVLINTIKLYETERLHSTGGFAPSTDPADVVPLFDGLTSFSIGHGDMIANQRKRLAAMGSESLAGRILRELIRRADKADTVFRRFASLHQDDATRWIR
jgi:hypothetical protein